MTPSREHCELAQLTPNRPAKTIAADRLNAVQTDVTVQQSMQCKRWTIHHRMGPK